MRTEECLGVRRGTCRRQLVLGAQLDEELFTLLRVDASRQRYHAPSSQLLLFVDGWHASDLQPLLNSLELVDPEER